MGKKTDTSMWQNILGPPCFGNWNCLTFQKGDPHYRESRRLYKQCSEQTREWCKVERRRRHAY